MTSDFKKRLHDLGINRGDVIFMHSSMKALQTDKTPVEFIDEIISYLGPEGTTLTPAFSWKSVNAENPRFNVKTTEIEKDIGLIPSTFMRMPGVVRSLHPTHSVCAFGKLANELTKNHIDDETPVGPNSPVMRILEYNGKILFIGDVVECCTFIHGIEEIVGAPYALAKERVHYVIEDDEGATIEKDMFPHDFWGWGAEYQRIKSILAYPEIKTGKIERADCYLVEAGALLKKATEKFKENPYYFVTDIRKYM